MVNYRLCERTKKNIEELVNLALIKNPKQIGTDGLLLYKSYIHPSIHKVELNFTRHVERFNLNLGTHLRYLVRKQFVFQGL